MKSDKKLIPIRETKSYKSKLIKASGEISDDSYCGRIVTAIGKVFIVEYEQDNSKKYIECSIAGKVITPHKKTSIAVVGDIVYFNIKKSHHADENEIAQIIKIEERKTKLARHRVGKTGNEQVIASNIDILVILMSAIEPYYNRRLIDRYLVSAEIFSLQAIICINKIDLVETDEIEEDLAIYEELGYPVFFISALDNIGINEISEELKDKTSIISGPSGAGKSTFINLLLGNEIQSVGEVSQSNFKGRHTTSFVQMFSLPSGGYIIDSPGIREFGLIEYEKDELALYFHEFDEYFPDCKYKGCTHTHEPDCRVKLAFEEGEIDPARYESYLSMLETLE